MDTRIKARPRRKSAWSREVYKKILYERAALIQMESKKEPQKPNLPPLTASL